MQVGLDLRDERCEPTGVLDQFGIGEIAAQLVTGKTSKQIGRVLAISSRTVDVYRARLMRKYATGNATELLQKLLGN